MRRASHSPDKAELASRDSIVSGKGGEASPPTGGLPEFLDTPLLELDPGEATASDILRQMRDDTR